MALADGETADRVAGKIHADERLGRAPAQLRVGAALHDAQTAPAPARRARAKAARARSAQRSDSSIGALHFGRLRRQLDALVELHLDVGAEQALDLDGALRRQHVARAVDVRLEAHALLADLADLAERHDLEAAASR